MNNKEIIEEFFNLKSVRIRLKRVKKIDTDKTFLIVLTAKHKDIETSLVWFEGRFYTLIDGDLYEDTHLHKMFWCHLDIIPSVKINPEIQKGVILEEVIILESWGKALYRDRIILSTVI